MGSASVAASWPFFFLPRHEVNTVHIIAILSPLLTDCHGLQGRSLAGMHESCQLPTTCIPAGPRDLARTLHTPRGGAFPLARNEGS